MLIFASNVSSCTSLLRDMGVDFCTIDANVCQSVGKNERPVEYVKRLSLEKAQQVRDAHPRTPILSAETIVSVGARILHKAENDDSAFQHMRLLSGRRHRVYTCVTLILPVEPFKMIQRLCTVHVAFKVLTTQEIMHFVASSEWRRANVYDYAGYARRFVRWMRGLPSTLEGLPFFETYQLLKGNGFIQEDIDVLKSIPRLNVH